MLKNPFPPLVLLPGIYCLISLIPVKPNRVLLNSNLDVIASVIREAISILGQEIASLKNAGQAGRKNIGLRNDIKIGGARLCKHLVKPNRVFLK
jgi:hypothetical protein